MHSCGTKHPACDLGLSTSQVQAHSYAVWFQPPLLFLGHFFLFHLWVVLKSILTWSFLTWNGPELLWSAFLSPALVLKCGLLTNWTKVRVTSSWKPLWPVDPLSMSTVLCDHLVLCPVYGWIQGIQYALLSKESSYWWPHPEGLVLALWLCHSAKCQQFVLLPPLPQATAELWPSTWPEEVPHLTSTSHPCWFLSKPTKDTLCGLLCPDSKVLFRESDLGHGLLDLRHPASQELQNQYHWAYRCILGDSTCAVSLPSVVVSQGHHVSISLEMLSSKGWIQMFSLWDQPDVYFWELGCCKWLFF